MQYTIDEAETDLSKLIELAEAGEEVIIARDHLPVVKLVVLTEDKPKRQWGGLSERKFWMADDFDEPLEDFREYME